MKYILFLPLLGILACCTPKQVKAPELASVDQCEKLYNHILRVQIDAIIADRKLTSDEREIAISLMDQEMRVRGTTGRFFGYCTNRMTPSQVECALQSNALNAIESCKLVSQ